MLKSFLFLAVLFFVVPNAFGGFLYVVNDATNGNTIYGFAVNEANGALTPLSGFPVSTGHAGAALSNLEMLTIDKTNKRLYVVNRGAGNVSAYSIDEATGALTPLAFSPIAAGVANPRTVDVHPSGSPLIVGGDTIGSINIAETATPAAGSPYTLQTGVSPAGSTLSVNGSYYYTGGNTGNFFSGYAVDAATGVLTPLKGSPFDSGNQTPNPTTTDAAGRLFVINSRQALTRIYSTAAGIPAQASASPFANGMAGFASQGKVHPNGGFFLLADRTGARVSSYAISGSGEGTTLATVAGSPYATGGSGSATMVFNESGNYLFVANGGARNLSIFKVSGSTGELSDRVLLDTNALGTAGVLTGIDYINFSSPAISTNIIGQVLNSGRPVSRATVRLTDGGGNVRTAITNAFGYFSFAEVMTGQNVTLSATHKLHTFSPETVAVTANLSPVVLEAE